MCCTGYEQRRLITGPDSLKCFAVAQKQMVELTRIFVVQILPHFYHW